MINYSSPDLTQHPPRSPHTHLGGYVHLPRLLDKARAHLGGTAGEYHYNCPLDQTFFEFTGINADEMLAAAKAAKSDTEALAWVNAHTKRTPVEIVQWSKWVSSRGASAVGTHEWFRGKIQALAPDRSDISTIFELLDLDDYASYGGKA